MVIFHCYVKVHQRVYLPQFIQPRFNTADPGIPADQCTVQGLTVTQDVRNGLARGRSYEKPWAIAMENPNGQ